MWLSEREHRVNLHQRCFKELANIFDGQKMCVQTMNTYGITERDIHGSSNGKSYKHNKNSIRMMSGQINWNPF